MVHRRTIWATERPICTIVPPDEKAGRRGPLAWAAVHLIRGPGWSRQVTSSLGFGGEGTVADDLTGIHQLGDPTLAPCLASLRHHPEFVHLVCGWEALPAEMRTGVLATMRAALSDKP